MRPLRHNIRLALQHLLAWVAFIVYEQAVLIVTAPWQFNLPFVASNYLCNALLFYANSSWLLPRLYARRRYVPYGGAALLLLTSYALLRNLLYSYLMPKLGMSPMPGSYWQLLLLSGYRGTFFLFVSAGYWFARHAVLLEIQKRKHEQQLRTAERSLLEANLAFLKSQINPHFLFNSLNFIYAQVYPLSPNAAKGILLLANTMRYALHEDSSGKVMLAQEIEHLHNYIDINQLRFNNQLQINFEIVGTFQFAMILPLVLITFVENCFKHGALHDADNPLVLYLGVVRNQLTFRTHNKKRDGPKEKSTGIGLVNTRKRLDIVYQSRYVLTVDDGPDHYTCTLIIDL